MTEILKMNCGYCDVEMSSTGEVENRLFVYEHPGPCLVIVRKADGPEKNYVTTDGAGQVAMSSLGNQGPIVTTLLEESGK